MVVGTPHCHEPIRLLYIFFPTTPRRRPVNHRKNTMVAHRARKLTAAHVTTLQRWKTEYAQLTSEMKRRHLSRATINNLTVTQSKRSEHVLTMRVPKSYVEFVVTGVLAANDEPNVEHFFLYCARLL